MEFIWEESFKILSNDPLALGLDILSNTLKGLVVLTGGGGECRGQNKPKKDAEHLFAVLSDTLQSVDVGPDFGGLNQFYERSITLLPSKHTVTRVLYMLIVQMKGTSKSTSWQQV